MMFRLSIVVLFSLEALLVPTRSIASAVYNSNEKRSVLRDRTGSRVRGVVSRDLGTGKDYGKSKGKKYGGGGSKGVKRPNHVSLNDINNKRGSNYGKDGGKKELQVESHKTHENNERVHAAKHSRNADIANIPDISRGSHYESNNALVEDGSEHFKQVDVEIYRRQIPSFSIHFNTDKTDKPPNMADYNELSEVTEEYMDDFFSSVFEELGVRHDGTILFLSVNEENPFTVDLVVTLEFIIPGEVPTVNFLINQLQDGLEQNESTEYFISDLSEMSRTNPFSKTESIEVVSRPPVNGVDMIDDIQIFSSNAPNAQHIIISFISGMFLVSVAVICAVWIRKLRKNKQDFSESGQSFALYGKSINSKSTSSESTSSSTGVHGTDDETVGYLNSIRKRYRDVDGKMIRGRKKDSVFRETNISAVEIAGSFDEQEDNNTVESETGTNEQEKPTTNEKNLLNQESNSATYLY